MYKRQMKNIIKAHVTRGAASPFAEFLAGFGIAGALYYAGLRGLQGELPLNEFISFLGAMMLAFQPLRRLAAIKTTIQEGLSAAKRDYNLLDQERLNKENKDAFDLKVEQGEIELKNVTLSYIGQKRSALNDISLSIPSGQITALVGPSGAGKTSILNLIPRFYDPSNGEVLLSLIHI